MSDKVRSSKKQTSNKKILLLLCVTVLFLVAICLICKHSGTEVPKMYIYLNGVSMDEIFQNDKNKSYPGNRITLDDGGGMMSFDDVEIKGRGNMTWKLEKKPFKIELKSKVDLLGLGKVRKWNLLANMLDGSEIRNDLAFKLAELLEMGYSSRGEYVDVYADNEYLGLYYMTTMIEIDKSTIDLREKEAILVEVDNAYCSQEKNYYLTSLNKSCLVLKDVRNKDEETISLEKFGMQFDVLEELAQNGDFEALKNVIDVESFAKYFLLNEFAGNPDGFFTSFYLYKDGDEDLIHAGPVWDFDGAFGNEVWWEDGNEEESYSPESFLVRREAAFGSPIIDEDDYNTLIVPRLMYHLIDIPEFQDEVKKVYYEKLNNKKETVLDYMRKRANYIRKSAIIDNKKWSKDDYDDSVDYLIWWVERRFDAFERMYSERIVLPEQNLKA